MYITIRNTAGTSPGPYNIYGNQVTPANLILSNVSLQTLTGGISINVGTTITSIIVVNTRNGCGGQQQAVTVVQQPTTPIWTVRLSAKLSDLTATATTASVYYRIDNSGFTYVGEVFDDICTDFGTVGVPDDSVLYIGMISGSKKIEFAASGSSISCGNAGPTQFCGISTPYIQRILSSDSIVVQGKVNAGSFAIATCGTLPAPPNPITPPLATPSIVQYSGTNYGLIRLQIVRNRSNVPVNEQLVDITQQIISPGLFDNNTVPDVLPGDIITVTITSADQPVQNNVSMTITDVINGNTLHTTSGLVVTDSYSWTLQSGTDCNISIINI